MVCLGVVKALIVISMRYFSGFGAKSIRFKFGQIPENLALVLKPAARWPQARRPMTCRFRRRQ